MLATRIATAALVLPLAVLGIIFCPPAVTIGVFAVLMLVGAWEWAGLWSLDTGPRLGFVCASAIAIALLVAWPTFGPAIATRGLIIGLACGLWVLSLSWIAGYAAGRPRYLTRTGLRLAIGGLMLVAPVVGVAVVRRGEDGVWLLLVMFAIVWAADTGAYFAGRGLGQRKLARHVSPGKTVEGAAGGILTALLVAGIAAWLLGYAGLAAVAFIGLAGLSAVASIVGDLTLSLFKRQAGVKDSGALFPGHGGVLDRLDGVLAATPWFAAGLYLLPGY